MLRWLRVMCAMVLLVAPLASLLAHAEVTIQDGQPYQSKPQGASVGGMVDADSTFKILRTNATGALMITDAAPAYTDFKDGLLVIGGATPETTAVGMADSSIVVNMGKYRLHALAIKVDPGAGAATPFSRVAISVRYHLNSQSDSASIFPIPLRRPVVAAGTADSLTLWARLNIPPTSVAFSDREAVFVVQRDDQAVAKWGMWGTTYLIIADQWGQPIWAPYISVRIRQLGGSGVMATKVYLLGTPQ